MKQRTLLAMILSLVMCLRIAMLALTNEYDPNNNMARTLLMIDIVNKKHILL